MHQGNSYKCYWLPEEAIIYHHNMKQRATLLPYSALIATTQDKKYTTLMMSYLQYTVFLM